MAIFEPGQGPIHPSEIMKLTGKTSAQLDRENKRAQRDLAAQRRRDAAASQGRRPPLSSPTMQCGASRHNGGVRGGHMY